jgi:Icc-related predicted phosphoesterase
MKKIVLISDTHTMHEDIILPKGDILIHAGDFTGRGNKYEVSDFFGWLERHSKDFEHIIFIAGNHDLSFEAKAEWIPSLLSELPDNIHYLEDQEIVIDGIKFYGSPWQPEFHNWAFNLPRGPELAEKWKLIPDDTDILITHGPPKYMCDFTIRDQFNAGCKDLLDRVDIIKPKIHVFGHIHEGYGITSANGIDFINASSCTVGYRPINEPIIIEYKLN